MAFSPVFFACRSEPPPAAAPASSAPMDAGASDLIDAIAEGRADVPSSDSMAGLSSLSSPDELPKQQQTCASASLNQPSVQQPAGPQQSAQQGAQKPKVELHMSTAVSR